MRTSAAPSLAVVEFLVSVPQVIQLLGGQLQFASVTEHTKDGHLRSGKYDTDILPSPAFPVLQQ